MRRHRIERAAGALVLGLILAACPDDGPQDPDPNVGDVTITTTTLANATQCEVYTEGVDAEGGNGEYSWEATGDLPEGIELNVEDLSDDDLVITGIPRQSGTFEFSLIVETTEGDRFTRDFTLVVLPATRVVIVSPVLAPGLVNAPYEVALSGCPGAAVTWSLQSGTLPAGLTLDADGTIHGTPTQSDTAEIVLRAVSGTLEATRAFTLQVVANRTGTYDITVVPVVPIPTSLQPAVDAAMDRLEAAVVGDLSSIPLGNLEPDDCSGFGDLINSTSVDDLILLVNIAPIDGPSQVLGFAGPCLVRNASTLPVLGILTLDVVDLGFLDADDQIALVTHETAHVLGFGSLWDTFDLISGTTDPRFTGTDAVAQWNALGGTGNVPLENTGGEGTARSHWRESVFGPELMTGFSNTGSFQALSRTSIASFADLGYTVDLDAADGFALPSPQATSGRTAQTGAGYDVVLRPVGTVDDRGRITPVTRGNR